MLVDVFSVVEILNGFLGPKLEKYSIHGKAKHSRASHKIKSDKKSQTSVQYCFFAHHLSPCDCCARASHAINVARHTVAPPVGGAMFEPPRSPSRHWRVSALLHDTDVFS
jgi:hypothetical protein